MQHPAGGHSRLAVKPGRRDKTRKIGLEVGNMSSWLYSGLVKFGFDVVCMETFQAHRFLATYRNKTDKNDARGPAQLVRMGGEDFLKVVGIRSQASQETRVLLAMRDHLVSQKVGLENHIAGVLKPFGVIVERGNVTADTLYKRTLEGLAEAEKNGVHVRPYVLPSLNLYMEAVEKIAPLTEKIHAIASSIEIVKRFMDIPGIGPITALSFYAAVDNPQRFQKSSDVAAYFGLTPRQFQSGETNFMGGISRRGDPATRRVLVIAATVLLSGSQEWNSLKAWGCAAGKTHRLLEGPHRCCTEAGDDHGQDIAQQRPIPAEEAEPTGTRQAQAGADRRCLENRTGCISGRLTKTPVSLKSGVLQQDGRWVSDV